MVDKSLDEAIESYDEDYILRKIREDYLADSTVTIFLIGRHSAESSFLNQTYIKRELQASLYNGTGNTRSGILGIVLPQMIDTIYKGSNQCSRCGGTHNLIAITDSTTIKEFNQNYYIEPHSGCAWSDHERYCILVGWDDFIANPEKYIEQAFDKRLDPIAEKVTVYPR